MKHKPQHMHVSKSTLEFIVYPFAIILTCLISMFLVTCLLMLIGTWFLTAIF